MTCILVFYSISFSWRLPLDPFQFIFCGVTVKTIYGKLEVVKGIFVNRELLVLFPVNCEITLLFLVKRDFGNRREPRFLIIFICETRIRCLIIFSDAMQLAMVGILLHTPNILLPCSIITNPAVRFFQVEVTKSSIHASK